MVMNTVHATYTETYDLNTAINELSLMAVHTPQATALKSMFKGFFENYKKYKIVGCNIGMVCASQQSLNPLEVGMLDGQADPRDILNPILFKACTGENLNTILNQIYGPNFTTTGDTSSLAQHIDSSDAAIAMYYQLLADDTWRKEHPQRGLFVQGLKPLVHKVVTTQPFRWTGSSAYETTDYPQIPGMLDGDSTQYHPNGFGGPSGQPVQGDSRKYAPNISNGTVFISDGTTDMPWLDTTFDGSITGQSIEKEAAQVRSNNLIVSVPRVFCGCIILPPAIVQRLFFRLQISWHVMFKDFRPAFEVGPIHGSYSYEDLGKADYFPGCSLGAGTDINPTYWNVYHDASTKLEKEFSSFDVNGAAEVTQVMENVQ